jgi:hypothetical protein
MLEVLNNLCFAIGKINEGSGRRGVLDEGAAVYGLYWMLFKVVLVVIVEV